MNDELVKKVRKIQASQIRESQKSVSFSSVVSQLLEKALK